MKGETCHNKQLLSAKCIRIEYIEVIFTLLLSNTVSVVSLFPFDVIFSIAHQFIFRTAKHLLQLAEEITQSQFTETIHYHCIEYMVFSLISKELARRKNSI